MFQGYTIEKLHRDEGKAILFADVVNRANIGVVQGRSSLRLALKAGQGLRVAGNLIGQELQRHKTVKPNVFSLVDHTHPATAEFLNDAVVRDGLANHQGQILRV